MTDSLALQEWISCLESEKHEIELALMNLRNLQARRQNGTSAILTRVVEASTPGRKRRGRKSMGQEERQVVSERMKRYWAGRRGTA